MNPQPVRAGTTASAVGVPVRFVLAGGFAAAVNFCSRWVLGAWLDYAVAIVIAYGIGMITAFVLNRRFVFRNATARLHQQVLRFVAVNMLALLQTLAISLLLARIILPRLGVEAGAESIGHALGIAVPILTSYFGHKTWTFR